MSDFKKKIVSADELMEICEKLRAEGQRVVQCHGCFDIVHPGHIRYLRFAKELGDVLVISVSGDDMVGKGPGRPYITESLRMENLAVLEFVDYVCLDDNDWAGPILEKLKPDIYVKGKEYEKKGDPRFTRERELVEGNGGTVVFSSGDVVYSSTYILSQFRERFPLERERLTAYCERNGIEARGVKSVLNAFDGRRVLVIGDAILDHYVHCDALGIASETPVLSVTPIRENWYAGAGVLIAAQLTELGGNATFLTSFHTDAEGERFASIAEQAGVSVVAVSDEDRPVAVKSRYLVEEQKVFKVDSTRGVPSSTQATKELARKFESLVDDYDAVVVTDFGYGLFTQSLIEDFVEITKRHKKPYYLDVSHTRQASILRFPAARIATPTEQELRFAFADNDSGLSHLASHFFTETGAEHLMLTMGKRGVLLFDRPDSPSTRLKTEFLPALESSAIDPVGAGDVFLVGAVVADVCGESPRLGAYLGSALAALHVATLGNHRVDSVALHRYLELRPELNR
jgi:rfaE bifunctional protein kinase chain/domain/rfaE bifunctional protein nucleotidyltransferase chain/domain